MGGGWEYSINGSWILSVSFKRLIGRKGNFSVSVCMDIGIVSWWIKSYISLCIVVGGLLFFCSY